MRYNLVKATENRILRCSSKENNLNNEELIKFISQYDGKFGLVKEYVSLKKLKYVFMI